MPFDTLECRKFLPHLIGNFCLPCQVRLQVFATFFLRWCRNQNDQYNNPKDSYLPDCMSRLLLNNIRCYGLCLLVTLEPTVDVFCGYVEPLNSFGALSFGSEAWTNAFGEGGTSSSPSSKSTSCKCRFACTIRVSVEIFRPKNFQVLFMYQQTILQETATVFENYVHLFAIYAVHC